MAYDGTGFQGFAAQPEVRTVEGVLTGAIELVLGSVARVSVAGRTDAGVHAEGQVVSFEADREVDRDRLLRSLNGMLGPEVAVLRVERAPPGFDARTSARSREYRYRVRTAEPPDPFTARYEWHRPGRLDVRAMRRAARALRGEHDFASFCRTPRPPGSTIRRLERLRVRARPGGLEIVARANAFCHQMVRSLVGTLVSVGEGRIEPQRMGSILAARSRDAAGPVAPPDGLTLVRVRYGASSP